MKTLILNGSPRRNGDTVSLIRRLVGQLQGEYRIVDACFARIAPCQDCRFCWTHDGCAVQDEMTEVYEYAADCDCVVIASPIWFSQPTGRLLDVGSRFQSWFAAERFRRNPPAVRPKKGAVMLVGGGTGSPEAAYQTACVLLRLLRAKEIYPLVCSFGTDRRAASEDENVLREVDKLAGFLNASNQESV